MGIGAAQFPNATYGSLETCSWDEGMKNEDAIEEKEEEETAEPVQETEPPPPSPAPAPEMTADSDPLAVSGGEVKSGGFLSMLNPIRMFRKKNPDFFINEGKDFLETQAYAQAMLAFNNALAIDPNSAAAFRGLGKVYYKKGDRSNMKTARPAGRRPTPAPIPDRCRNNRRATHHRREVPARKKARWREDRRAARRPYRAGVPPAPGSGRRFVCPGPGKA